MGPGEARTIHKRAPGKKREGPGMGHYTPCMIAGRLGRCCRGAHLFYRSHSPVWYPVAAPENKYSVTSYLNTRAKARRQTCDSWRERLPKRLRRREMITWSEAASSLSMAASAVTLLPHPVTRNAPSGTTRVRGGRRGGVGVGGGAGQSLHTHASTAEQHMRACVCRLNTDL